MTTFLKIAIYFIVTGALVVHVMSVSIYYFVNLYVLYIFLEQFRKYSTCN
jgi:hypothetical protein